MHGSERESVEAAQVYCIGLLVEEAGEVNQLLGKALRFGIDSPGIRRLDGSIDMEKTARTMLPVELGDLLAAIDFARDHGLFNDAEMWRAYKRKYDKLCDESARDNLGRPLAPRRPLQPEGTTHARD